MLNNNLISNFVQPIQLNWTIDKTIEIMVGAELTHLPVVNNKKYCGLLAQQDVTNAQGLQTIADIQYHLQPVSVLPADNYFKTARILVVGNLPLVPVIEEDGVYIGVIMAEDILTTVANNAGVHDTGGLLMLHIEPLQFSVGELSKLVETNDAQITQLNTTMLENGMMQVIIRINKREVSDILATLQRYNYQVEYFSGDEYFQNELQRNYNLLMNFLEM